ncbi:hypothetical protein KC317_g8533 [Hortaea werneckii]|nr:hypothetical protein KC317_g8533 [Hortaea werneckii]KAI7599715.1 hypothetical protein KC346_g13605 [Hortaea werneckii]
MGTTTYTQPFKQGFGHASTTNTTTAPAVSKPWYASLDSLPESGKFNGGNINISSLHCTSYDHQPKSSPQAQMRTRRFSNAEIERVIEEELEIADDIPAPWPLEFEEASPPNTIRKATRQEPEPLQFPLEVEAPSQVEKAGAWKGKGKRDKRAKEEREETRTKGEMVCVTGGAGKIAEPAQPRQRHQ